MIERLDFGAGAPHDADELGIHVARYGLVRGLCRGRRVLDIACGTGFGSYLMVERWGAASVDAVDVSAEAIASARALFGRPEIRWHQMDANVLDPGQLPGPYDLIVSLETIEHLDDPERFLRALKALRGAEGVIVLSCPNDHWYYGRGRSKNVWHKQTYTFDEFKAQAEGILGPAHSYLLGTTVAGFSNVRLSPDGLRSPTMIEALRHTRDTATLQVPGMPTTGPTVDRSLYFVGVWGPVGPEDSAAIVAVSPDHRWGVEHLRPHFVREDRVKPRVVLVADIPGWAYDNIAQQIRSALDDTFDIVVVYAAEYEDWIACIHDVVYVRQADLAHFFWREYLFAILAGDPTSRVCERYGMSEQSFQTMFTMLTLTTSVYDHLYLDDASIRQREPLLGCVDGYSVSSEKLYDAYRERYATPPNVVIEDGVDLTVFRPATGGRPPAAEREVVVGWAGNSQWNRTDTWDPKGLHTILKPALERLRAEGVRVRGHFIDSSEERRPRSEMPAFYQEIDIYVCVSEIEGTPNPVLEAMACGVPVISTDVGIVPQVLGAEQRRFILPDRSVETVVARLRTLIGDTALRQRLSDENLARIRNWSWARLMPKWLQLFKAASQHKRATLPVTLAQAELMRHELRSRGDALATAQKLAEERLRRLQEMEAAIAERDAAAREQTRRVAHLERELARARTLRGMLGRVAEWLRPGVASFVVLVWPLVLLLAGGTVFTNPDYAQPSGGGPSWLLSGHLLHRSLPMPLGDYVLPLGVHIVGALGLFLTVRELFGGRGAVLSTLWMGSYVGFRTTVAWDWVDGAAIAYALGATYCLTRGARRRAWRAAVTLAGAAATAMVATHPLTVVLVPVLALHFVLLNRRFEAHALGPALAFCAAGGAAVGLVLGLAAVVTGEPSLAGLDPRLWRLDWLGAGGPPGAPGAEPMPMAAYASLPLATLAGCVVYVTLSRFRRPTGWLAERWQASHAAFAATLLSAEYICTTAALLALHGLDRPILVTHDEAGVLIPGMMLVFGALCARILLGLSRLQYVAAIGTAAVLFVVPWIPPVGAALRAIVESGAGSMFPLLPAAMVCVGVVVLWLLRLSLASVVIFCLCASLANATVASVLPQDRARWAGGILAHPQSASPLRAPR